MKRIDDMTGTLLDSTCSNPHQILCWWLIAELHRMVSEIGVANKFNETQIDPEIRNDSDIVKEWDSKKISLKQKCFIGE